MWSCDVNTEEVKGSQDILALNQRSLWFDVDVTNIHQVKTMVKKQPKLWAYRYSDKQCRGR
jgi:hypothetical protein